MERRARCFRLEEGGRWKLELRRRDYTQEETTWSLPRVPTPKEHPLRDQGSGEEPKKDRKFSERRRRRTNENHTAMVCSSSAEIRLQGSKEEKKKERKEERKEESKEEGKEEGKEGEGSEETKFSSDDDGAWDDPLCSPLLGEEEDPLSAQEPSPRLLRHDARSRRTTLDQCAEEGAAAWNARKVVIMQKFTATGIISVSLSFDIMSKEPKGKVSSITSRLEELDNPLKEAREETKIISQQEYVTYLRLLKSEIALAWRCDERVLALKAAVKVARLLSDTSVPQFYPTLFVLVTDIMDTVGELVWNRIKARCERDDNSDRILCPLPAKFTSDDVRPEAKQTCLNWFHKIGSIHELLPRLYIEMAIARCYYFLQSGPPVLLFQRLTSMIRGLADPLAAAYAQLYLARRGLCIMPLEKVHLVQGLDDFLQLFRRVLSHEFDEHMASSGVDFGLYLQLMEPAIQFIVQCMLRHASPEFMREVVAIFGQGVRGSFRIGGHGGLTLSDAGKGRPPVASVVYWLLTELPATFVTSSARLFAAVIKDATDGSVPQHMSYGVLGRKLCECAPPREQRLAVFNDVWRVVSKQSCLPEYLSVADAFTDYVLKNFTQREVDTFLGDILHHTKNAKVDDGALAILESILFKLLTHYHELVDALSLQHFIGILDLFYGELQVSMYKRILLSVVNGKQQVADVVAVHFLFDIAKALHDSLDSISGDNDRQQVARLITRFIQLVDFKKDREQGLNFLVDCRAVFFNTDYSQQAVAHLVNNLAIRVLLGIAGAGSGIHTKRTKDFAKACVSFNEITILSIRSVIVRLHLFLESAEVALLNGFVGHSETLLKSAATCLQEGCIGGESWAAAADKPATKEGKEQVVGFLCKVAGFLVVAPGHPEYGVFYFLKGLLNVLDDHPWLSYDDGLLQRGARTCCAFLLLMGALFQERLPCHVVSIESNDTLYSCEEGYKQEVAAMANDFVGRLVSIIDQARPSDLRARRALDFCNSLLICFKVTSQLSMLCYSLIEIAAESLPQTDSYFVQTVQYAAFMGLDRDTKEKDIEREGGGLMGEDRAKEASGEVMAKEAAGKDAISSGGNSRWGRGRKRRKSRGRRQTGRGRYVRAGRRTRTKRGGGGSGQGRRRTPKASAKTTVEYGDLYGGTPRSVAKELHKSEKIETKTGMRDLAKLQQGSRLEELSREGWFNDKAHGEVPHQQCHVGHSATSAVSSSATLVTVPRQHDGSIADYKQRFQAQLTFIEAEEQRQLSAEAARLQAEAAATAEKLRLQAEADADAQARRKEAQDLLQWHEANSIERLKFWHFEPNGNDATPEEQHKEFLSKLVTRLLYACSYQRSELERQNQELKQQYQDLKTQHQELANLRRMVQSHEDATRALNSRVLDLEQAVPGPDVGASSSGPSSRQLEERVDHVVAMLGDISTFAAPTTISSQLDTLKTEVQQLQSTNSDGNPKLYKMPTFQLEKFDDYTHQDPVLSWEAFTTQLRILPVAKHAYISALFLNSKDGCQTWLTHLAATHGVDVADLKDKITWEELTRLWKKRFIVDDAPALAINRLFTMSQGNTATPSPPSIAGDSTSWSRLEELDPLTFVDFQWMPVPSTGRLPKPHCNVLMAQLRDYLHIAVPTPLMDAGVEVVDLHAYIAKIDCEFKTQRRSLEEHVEHLRTVLERLGQAKYKANRDKCEFVRQELEYLGHYVTPQGIRPLANKIEALRVWPEPTNTTDVLSFMGLAGYYQRFITGYSRIAALMTRLQLPKAPFVFDDDARRSFQALKTAMLMAPVLSIYDPTLATRVTTDTSGYIIGAVLEQHDGDD
ncbi:hypothetical protein CBR_g49709 [Chara braunii]|uniref:Reverse transcriptase/retrotransposon-derived protein RNase H-like domain-containing protein n=1 Tax=Chara braunii TaxID=69332 RepID=A0A388M5M7_CHABU|nr:hypothetical protein CBR_g49709 [Chara braunii]|eukprot:GBG89861.1 hypothetical protein CBR_g49709 [Chara braunii]